MRRGVEMHEHADERPALALTPVLPPRWRLRDQPRLLEDEARPRVREAKAVVLDRVLVEVLDGEALVVPRVEAAEPGDRLEPNAPAARPRPAVIADAVPALLLEAPFEPAHVAGRDAEDVGGLDPRDLLLRRHEDDLLPRHCPHLGCHPPLVHRSAVAVGPDSIEGLWTGHVRCPGRT